MFLVMRKTVSTGQKNFLALVPTGKTNFSFLVSITWTPWRNPALKRIFYSAYLKVVLFLSHRFNLVYQIDPDIPQDLKLDHTTQFTACTMHMHSKKNRILRSAKLILAQNTALNADDKESYKYNPDKLRDIVKDFLTSSQHSRLPKTLTRHSLSTTGLQQFRETSAWLSCSCLVVESGVMH